MRRWLDFPETVRAFGRVAVPWDLVVDFWKTMFPQADNGDDYFDDLSSAEDPKGIAISTVTTACLT